VRETSRAGSTEDLQEYGGLSVGDKVYGPGPRPSAPRETGTLLRIYVLYTARGKGVWARVERDSGGEYSTAVGLLTKAAS
jgi:hypothetical protein